FGHLRCFLFLLFVPIVALKLKTNESHVLEWITTQDGRPMQAAVACRIWSHDLTDVCPYLFFANTWPRIRVLNLAHNNLRFETHGGWINLHELNSVRVVHSTC